LNLLGRPSWITSEPVGEGNHLRIRRLTWLAFSQTVACRFSLALEQVFKRIFVV
jgi:hypothetical protein